MIALEEVPADRVNRYGIVDGKLGDGVFEIRDLVEKPPIGQAPSNHAIIGRYILTHDVFDHLAKVKPGAGGEIQLTDALRALARKRPIYGIPIKGKRFDAGRNSDFSKRPSSFRSAVRSSGRHLQNIFASVFVRRYDEALSGRSADAAVKPGLFAAHRSVRDRKASGLRG